MAQISIYRASSVILTVNIDERSSLYKSLNGADKITMSFALDSFTEILIGDYITWRGVRYTIFHVPEFKKISEVHYEYSLIFQGPQYSLEKVLFLLDGQGEFFLTGTAEDFIDLIVNNLNRVYGTGQYSRGSVPASDFKNLHFDQENCLQILQRVCEEYSLEFYFDPEKTINLVDAIGNDTGLEFEYRDGLRNIKRLKIGDKNIITRLYAFGSDKNIDYNYGAKRLKLTTGYIEKNTSAYGIIEAVKVFDDIYPHFSGAVDSCPSITQIVDTAINFDLNSYLIEGSTAKIVFLSGDMAGYEFEIVFYEHSTKTVTFKTYTGEDGLTLPNSTVKPAPGDEFTFVDIRMPSAYITAAEASLLSSAQEYLDEMADPNVIYEVEMDWHTIKQGLLTLDVGDQFTITDTQLAPSGVSYRILELTQSLANEYKYSVKLGQGLLMNYFQKIESAQEAIKQVLVRDKDDSDRRTRRALQATEELQEMIYDPDGYFDTSNIKPLSIEAGMIAVGMKGQQLMLRNIEFNISPGGDNTQASWTAGNLVHYTIDQAGVKTWDISSGSITGLTLATSYYIFARCEKATTSGVIILTTTQYVTDPGGSYYYFLLGVLHASVSGERAISITYGATSITGRLIKTGKISSFNGSTYFDLDNNQIVIAAGSVAGFTVDAEKLSFSNSNKYLYINNAVKTSGNFGRGFTLYDAAADYTQYQISVVGVGQLHTLDTRTIGSGTPEYGLEVIKATGPGFYKHLVRLGASTSLIAGWNIDYDAIYTGTKKTSDGYSTSGITLAANGSIHAQNFYINSDGSITAREISLDSSEGGDSDYWGNISLKGNALNLGGASPGSKERAMFINLNGDYPGSVIIGANDNYPAIRITDRVYISKNLNLVTGLYFPYPVKINTINPPPVTLDSNASMVLYSYTNGNGTVNLPANPTEGQVIIVVNTTTTRTCTVEGNGKNIYDAGATYTSRAVGNRQTFAFMYIVAADAWSTLFYR